MPFDLQVVGNGQAKRPFAPSLDRKKCEEPYTRANVRLVVAVANFAMNAWGFEPLQSLASALCGRQGSDPQSVVPRGPSDSDLDSIATLDNDFVETDAGILSFPPRPDVCSAIAKLLEDGPQSSRFLEERLAESFDIAPSMRSALLRNNCPAWRNHVAWALVDLGKRNARPKRVERVEGRAAPDGGTMGIYRLRTE